MRSLSLLFKTIFFFFFFAFLSNWKFLSQLMWLSSCCIIHRDQQTIDFNRLDAHVHQLKGSSSRYLWFLCYFFHFRGLQDQPFLTIRKAWNDLNAFNENSPKENFAFAVFITREELLHH